MLVVVPPNQRNPEISKISGSKCSTTSNEVMGEYQGRFLFYLFSITDYADGRI